MFHGVLNTPLLTNKSHNIRKRKTRSRVQFRIWNNFVRFKFYLLFKVKNKNIRSMFWISSKSTIKTTEFFKSTFLIPAGNYMFKVNNRNTRTSCEICSKLTIKTPERRHWRRTGVFTVNFEHISELALVFLLLTLSR